MGMIESLNLSVSVEQYYLKLHVKEGTFEEKLGLAMRMMVLVSQVIPCY